MHAYLSISRGLLRMSCAAQRLPGAPELWCKAGSFSWSCCLGARNLCCLPACRIVVVAAACIVIASLEGLIEASWLALALLHMTRTKRAIHIYQ